MADNVAITAGSGTTVATDEVGGVHYQRFIDYDPDVGLGAGITTLRDTLTAQRYTVLADSVADGLAAWWVTTVANGGTFAASGGEGLLQTSANAAGSAQSIGATVGYL